MNNNSVIHPYIHHGYILLTRKRHLSMTLAEPTPMWTDRCIACWHRVLIPIIIPLLVFFSHNLCIVEALQTLNENRTSSKQFLQKAECLHLCHLYPLMKLLSWWEWSFQDDSVPKQRPQGVTEWIDEYENKVNHMLWLSQSPHLNPVEYLWETVLGTTLIETLTEGISFGRVVFHPPSRNL